MGRGIGHVRPHNRFDAIYDGPQPYHIGELKRIKPVGFPEVVVIDDQMFQSSPRVAALYARECRGQGNYRGRIYTLDGQNQPEHHVGWAFYDAFSTVKAPLGWPNNLIYCFDTHDKLMHLEEM